MINLFLFSIFKQKVVHVLTMLLLHILHHKKFPMPGSYSTVMLYLKNFQSVWLDMPTEHSVCNCPSSKLFLHACFSQRAIYNLSHKWNFTGNNILVINTGKLNILWLFLSVILLSSFHNIGTLLLDNNFFSLAMF